MFKVSDDLDSDDDFPEEFTDDFFSCSAKDSSNLNNPPGFRRPGSSSNVTPKSYSVDVSGGSMKKLCEVNEFTPMRSQGCANGIKSSTPIAQGFQSKTKTLPGLLTTTNTSSSHFEKTAGIFPPLRCPSNGTSLGSCSNEELIHRSSSTKHVDPPPRVPPFSDEVNINSAFLTEWNDSFFNEPPGKQPVSSAVRTHTHEVVTRKLSRTVRQRRFPGPAGLLPPRQGNTSLIAPEEFLNELKDEENDPTYQETEILSQSSGSVFEGGSWTAMLEDLGASGHSLLESMNLASIKAIGRSVRSYKVPFLSVLVQTIDASLPDAAVVFKDPTGEMHGVIHRDVWDQFGSDIAVGAVLVLRNVGIISAGVSSRKHVINITGNNLTAIYSPKDELNIQLRRIHEFATSTSSKMLAEWEKVESRMAASPVTGRAQMQPRNSPLFNGFQNGGCYSGNISGTPDSRPPFHPRLQHPASTSIPRAVAPSSNQRNRPIAPRYSHTGDSKAPDNQRNGPLASGTYNRNATTCLKPCDGGINRISNPSSATNSCLNSTASSTSSPFSPMPIRPNSWSAHQNSPVNTNNENCKTAGNQKFSSKSPFAVKAPSNARSSPQPPPNLSTSSALGQESNYRRPPLTPQPSAPSTIPIKKPKLGQSSAPSKKNPFQVEADTSVIDTLLEGIDTDSLFGDF